MFEKFTDDARIAVVQAQAIARRWADPEIGAQHLLAALIDAPNTPPGRLLAEHQIGWEQLTQELAKISRRGGVTDADSEALRDLGIDVEAVVRQVESTHGENALRGSGETSESSGRGRLFGLFGGEKNRGHIPFTTEAKRVLTRTLHEAVQLGDRHIDGEHMLLSLVSTPGVCADLLTAYGLDHATIRAHLAAKRAS